ncbi:hypothetical protein [Variovorax sp. E3]|uniref:hypothetical protein n=1 Tax=Variovorax sp. E3 TaxID=1914993 RepID=UPI0018DB44D1|nr:hypothetical protein [Variovorax sp. E3]
MTPKEVRIALSEGLSSWLTFEHHAGREELFGERYLALPIGQILQRCMSGKVTGESNHPILTTPGKTGRPPQLDFIVTDATAKVVLAVESKWAAHAGVSVADVLWDCIRLELAADYYKCDAIFILAGTRKQVDAVLKSRSFSTKNSRLEPTYVLNLHGLGKHSVKINSFEGAYSVPLHKILRTYPSVSWPSELVCGSGTQVPKQASAGSYTAVVWHIAPAGNAKRRPFIALSENKATERRKRVVDSIGIRLAAKRAAAKKLQQKSRE